MKKYTLFSFVFVLSIILLGSLNVKSVNAMPGQSDLVNGVSGCMTGDLFSRTTGQSCGTTVVSTDCAVGDLFSHITGQPCPTPSTSSGQATTTTPTLQIGSRGSAVIAFQQILANAGYSVGKIDGIYGKMTAAAASAYYRTHPCPMNSSGSSACAPLPTPTPIVPISSTQTYSNSTYGVNFNYSNTWTTDSGSSTWANFFNGGGADTNATSLVTLDVPSSLYSGTDFVSANLNLSVDQNMTSSQCSALPSSGNMSEGSTTGSVIINGVNFNWSSREGAAAGTDDDTYLYSGYTNNTCYEFSLVEVTNGGADGNLPAETDSWTALKNAVTSAMFTTPGSTTTPVISSITPTSGPDGTQVTITGTNFTPTGNKVIGMPGNEIQNQNISSPNGTTMTFSIFALPLECPIGSTNCNPAGAYQLTVTNVNGTSNSINFTLTSGTTTTTAPIISSLSTTSGPVGTLVTITGSGFTSTGNSIFSNGHLWSSVASSNSGTNLTFSVPNIVGPSCSQGACPMYIPSQSLLPGIYPIDVVNTNGTSNAVNFTVTSSTGTCLASGLDSNTGLPCGCTSTSGFSLTTGVSCGGTTTTPPSGLSITTPYLLPNAYVGTPYSANIGASGGSGSYGWSIGSNSAFPPGLSFGLANCANQSPCQAPTSIVGTPTTAGTYTFLVNLSSGSLSTGMNFNLTVNPSNTEDEGYQVSNLQANVLTTSPTSVNLSWSTASANVILDYNIYRTTYPSQVATVATSSNVLIAQTTGLSYIDANLSPGYYYYTIFPVDTKGNTGMSSSTSATINSATGTVTATLDPFSPQTTNYNAGQTGATFAEFDLSNTSSNNVIVNNIQVSSDSVPANQFIKNIKILSGNYGVAILPNFVLSGSNYVQSVPVNLTVPANSSIVLTLSADVVPVITNGNAMNSLSMHLGITNVTFSGTNSVNVTGLPVWGKSMNLVSATTDLSSVTVTSPTSGATWTEGTTQTINWQCNAGNTSSSTCGSSQLYSISATTYNNPDGSSGNSSMSYNLTNNGVTGNSYSWTVGNVVNSQSLASGNYLITVCKVGVPVCSSGGPFSINANNG